MVKSVPVGLRRPSDPVYRAGTFAVHDRLSRRSRPKLAGPEPDIGLLAGPQRLGRGRTHPSECPGEAYLKGLAQACILRRTRGLNRTTAMKERMAIVLIGANTSRNAIRTGAASTRIITRISGRKRVPADRSRCAANKRTALESIGRS